jgi:NADH-quinone oxidoreductase subunit J
VNAEVVVFIVFAVVAVVGALTMVAARNPVYSAMGLLSSMFAIAVFYVMNDAHFVAAVQVLIYAGAVMTLFLFVIMLIGVDASDDRSEQLPFQRPIGLLLGVGLVALVLLAGRAVWVTGVGTAPGTSGGIGTIENVAAELFGAWLLPFEATVLLLTIAAIGTVALARFSPGDRFGKPPLVDSSATPPSPDPTDTENTPEMGHT